MHRWSKARKKKEVRMRVWRHGRTEEGRDTELLSYMGPTPLFSALTQRTKAN